MNTKEDAIEYIYRSYLKAEKYLKWDLPDSEKRNPMFSRQIVKDMMGTPCVLVTGSKGKGSVSNMIAEIFQTRYKVGLMTSPHILEFNERFRVNGQKIGDAKLIEMVSKLKPQFDAVEERLERNQFISPMGIQAAIALSYFNECQTEFNVFECGKGVKYDDVNNIMHECAVINTIFLEHKRELGQSIREIAENKSEIMAGAKKGVYVGIQPREAMEVIAEKANLYGVKSKVYGQDFKSENIKYTKEGMIFDVTTQNNRYKDIRIPLLGDYQAYNCALAISFCEDNMEKFDVEECKKRLEMLAWPGRMEIVTKDPFLLLDGCINRESCKQVKIVMGQLKIEKPVIIIGIPDDKDYVGVAQEMQAFAKTIILTKSENPHYKFTSQQKEVLERQGISSVMTDSVKEALELAHTYRSPVCILGTTSVISDVKRLQK